MTDELQERHYAVLSIFFRLLSVVTAVVNLFAVSKGDVKIKILRLASLLISMTTETVTLTTN